jgi:hypothetical protein
MAKKAVPKKAPPKPKPKISSGNKKLDKGIKSALRKGKPK